MKIPEASRHYAELARHKRDVSDRPDLSHSPQSCVNTLIGTNEQE